MHLLKTICSVVLAIMRCLVCMVCLPLAHVGTDRVGAYRAYLQSLDNVDREYQQRRRWSVLRILERAARRQEKLNVRGQAKFDELQQRKWDRWYAYKLHAVLLLRIFAIGYGCEALGAALESHYPDLFFWWQGGMSGLNQGLRWFWGHFPGPD